MKTALKIISFIVFIMIGMSSVTKAQNTHMQFNVNITDSCSGTWTGDYCIKCYVMGGSNQYCLYTHCGFSQGNNPISYYCTIDPIVTDADYIIYVTVCRDQNPPVCCGSGQSPSVTYSKLQDWSQTIYITL